MNNTTEQAPVLPLNIRVYSTKYTLRTVLLQLTPAELTLGDILDNFQEFAQAVADHLGLELQVIHTDTHRVAYFVDRLN